MNGGHDLGGMHGLGPINAEPESQEPVFHADWERRVFGMAQAIGALGKSNRDMGRHARERQHPADYLKHSYYENWLAGLETLLVETGLVTADELAANEASELANPELRQRAAQARDVGRLIQGNSSIMEVDAPPRFRIGNRIRAVNRHPTGHTREPRYVRGRVGIVHGHHGVHVFPDESARGIRLGRHLYSVRFEARELWGTDADGRDAVLVDLWEDYLEPV